MKQLTGKMMVGVVFDFTVDDFTNIACSRLKGKLNVEIVSTTTDGDVFDRSYKVAVVEKSFQGPERVHLGIAQVVDDAEAAVVRLEREGERACLCEHLRGRLC